jgi:hypothetical protein
MGVITHARPLTFGTYPSDSLQPGLGQVDSTSHSASHSGPGPLADTMVRVPHGSWRDDAARVVRPSLMSTEVSLATSLYATWIVLTYQPTILAACRRPSRLCVQTPWAPLPVQGSPGSGVLKVTESKLAVSILLGPLALCKVPLGPLAWVLGPLASAAAARLLLPASCS